MTEQKIDHATEAVTTAEQTLSYGEYVPTTDEVRETYQSSDDGLDFKRRFFERGEELDRWLAAHDAEVRAAALADQGKPQITEYDPEKDERLTRFMAMATPLGYQSAFIVVQEMTKLLAAENEARRLGKPQISDDLREDIAVVKSWLDDDDELRIPDTRWGRALYASLRSVLAALGGEA